ncbi:MAG: hypothetical protein AAF958_09015 [Planctomycetota bacterium]
MALAIVGAADGSAGKVRRQVDLVELNHFMDDDGREVFRQVIFYDWSHAAKRYHVRAWRLIKKDSQQPCRHWRPSGYLCTWTDDGEIREVWAGQMKETWSREDPERINRKYLPEAQRVPLFE